MKSKLLSMILAGIIAAPICAAAGTKWEAEAQRIWIPSREVVTEDTQEQIQEEIYQGELALVAAVAWAEAEGEDLMGKRLVVDTILNRVESQDFPNTITEVVFQRNAFAPVMDGRLLEAYQHVTAEEYEAVTMELEHRQDPNVLYFTAGEYSSYGTPLYRYGNHYFSGR